VLLAVIVLGRSSAHPQSTRGPTSTGERSQTHQPAKPPRRLAERAVASLAGPLQDVAAVPLAGRRMLLFGGLTANDTSSDAIQVLGSAGSRTVGRLPIGLHDTAAVKLGRNAYIFGGGTASNTQSNQILRVPAAARAATVVGRLPEPSSDQAAARLGGVAYIVGGYTGIDWLNTIVAWAPGRPAHVVAYLPTSLRYAAVSATRGRLLIAGGSLPNGTASKAIYEYRPGDGVRQIGRLPAATTHAAGAAIGGVGYVIGGRGALLDSVVSRIVAVDPLTGHTREVGQLNSPRSDLTAIALGRKIVLIGGRGRAGTESTVTELVPASHASPDRTRPPATTTNVYAYDGANMLTGAARLARPLVYVPNSDSASVDVIDPRTFKVVKHFPVGLLPQHVVPSYDLTTLYVTNDAGNSLTLIDPRTGKPGRTIPVEDPYNMYFTPDGRYAIVVAERLHRLDFRNPHNFALHHSLEVPCAGVDHMDFSADGTYLIASCEFSGQLVKVMLASERVVGVLNLPDGPGGMPQDVRISPDGSIFYVADLAAGGVWKINGRRLRVIGFIHTGAGAHGLYPSRNGKDLYVSNRGEGSVSVISFRTQTAIAKWRIPGGGSPDMGGVSANGNVLWLSGRYNSQVYAISTRTGHLLARIPVGNGPHGLCVWPQPGRYSLGHTDNMR
jgi:YVTN family beta-propeller protein